MKLVYVALLLLGPAVHATNSLADDAQAVLSGVNTPRDQRVSFTELRMNELLSEPVELRGELYYSSSGELSKYIVSPVTEKITISESTIRMERNGKIRTTDTSKSKEIGWLYAALRAVLDGDYRTIMETFSANVEKTGDDWIALLIPRQERMQREIGVLTITGSGTRIKEIRFERSATDWQVLRLSND